MALPAAPITVVHRTDGSGTTFNFANYLSKVSPEWKEKVGEGVAVEWPVGVGGKGNEGVAAYVGLAKNSISYVEYAYAIKNNLAYGLVQDQSGAFRSAERGDPFKPRRRPPHGRIRQISTAS